jgi:hypothetical protein
VAGPGNVPAGTQTQLRPAGTGLAHRVTIVSSASLLVESPRVSAYTVRTRTSSQVESG